MCRVIGCLLIALGVAAATGWAQAPANVETAEDEALLKTAKIATDGAGLLKFFHKRTLTAADRAKITDCIRQLGHRSFNVREGASKELTNYGAAALAQLRRALNDPDTEVKHRAQDCIEAIEHGPDAAQAAAACRLLKARNPAGATDALIGYLPFAADETVEDEALLALLVGVRGGKVDPVLLTALKDAEPARRSAAALLVGRSGAPEQQSAVRPLLTDAQTKVRLRAAQGLLAGKDKTAVPTLVALLSDGAASVAEQAEDMLVTRSQGNGPQLGLGSDDAARRRCRNAWEAWWKTNQARTDLTKMDLDVALFDQTARCREVARQFLNGIVKRDAALLKRITDAPFCLQGAQTYNTRAELDQFIAQICTVAAQAKFNFKVGAVTSAAEYSKKASTNEKNFLNGAGKSLRVVSVALDVDGRSQQMGVFARVNGSRTRVIGLAEQSGRQ